MSELNSLKGRIEGASGLTDAQRELARHALGLPNSSRRSYRNRFVASAGHRDYTSWMAMVESGHAERYDGKELPFGGSDLFELTRKGAEAALKGREKLCPEDFPPIALLSKETDHVE